MEKLSKEKVRAIGVSNFNIDKLEKLAKTSKTVPAANQVSLLVCVYACVEILTLYH